MSKKKKKKPQVSAKLQHAQKFNDFKNRLMLIAEACNAVEAFNLLPKREIDIMFISGFKPFDLVAHEGQKMTPDNYKILKEIVKYFLKNETITFVDGGKPVNLYEYYYVGECLRSKVRNIKDSKFKGVDEFAKAFKPICDKHAAPDGPHERLLTIATNMANIFSRVNKGYWLFHFDMINQFVPYPEFRTCFKVEYVPPDVTHFTLGGNTRPAYQVGWPVIGQEVLWAQVTPKQLNIESQFDDLKIKVYIQSHALHRMNERLDCLSENLRHFILFQNVSAWETVTNHRGEHLITCRIVQSKVGYLVYEYIQGAVVIKTFLLLTHNDTPEGEKLNELLGLEKTDKHYLVLDKLSGFIKSDIPTNPTIFEHFVNAGCAELFNLDASFFAQNVHENLHAALIEEYINAAKIE
jgi:hypothetical protein